MRALLLSNVAELDNPLAVGWAEMTAWLQEHPYVSVPLALLLLGLAAWATLLLVRVTALPAIGAIARRAPHRWLEIIVQHKTLDRLAYAVPVLVVFQGATLFETLPAAVITLLQRLAVACAAIVVVQALSAFLNALNDIYNQNPLASERPIKGILQVISVISYIAATIFVIAALLDRSPLLLLSGLGAMSAIVMLVFRDSILSLVAGFQVTRTGAIRLGDWIEMPQFNADGAVIDIALNSVTVQNWDRTFTVIPAHRFLEHSFKNWRGMQQSGGRRIKRSILIDLSTVRFLTPEEVDRFERFALLRDYIREKKRELEEHNRRHATDPSIPVNVRRLTNIGTLRAYIDRYLRQHPGIHQGMTLMVRQLQPTEQGLPLEIYVFTNDVRWVNYEAIQSDIFDHILAAVPHFGLRIFQNPTGHDLARIWSEAERTAENRPLGEMPASIAPAEPET